MSANPDALYEKLKALPPQHRAEVEDFVDFLRQRGEAKRAPTAPGALADFPVDHVGQWPESLSLRREDLYGDEGR